MRLVVNVSNLTMYTTTWCGYCRRLKNQLSGRASLSTRSTSSIRSAPADLVERLNGGNQTVPTLVFPDGSALTNPSLAQVTDKLAAAYDRGRARARRAATVGAVP